MFFLTEGTGIIMSNKVTFVGQAPSREGQVPWTGDAGARLARLMRIPQSEMLELFDFVNVFEHFPGKTASGRGDRFPMPEARVAARRLWESGRISSRVILLGSNVCRAFDLFPDMCRFSLVKPAVWHRGYGPIRHTTTIPHPSGMCRFYNDVYNKARVAAFLVDLVKDEQNKVNNFSESSTHQA